MTATCSKNQNTLSPLMSSDRMDWCTPPEVLDPLRAALGPIGLDPCWNENAITEPAAYYTQHGLENSWRTFDEPRLVFVNPPYGRALGAWTRKAFFEAAHFGTEIVLLVPARTDTKWFQPLWQADALCFWEGRIKFLGADGHAPFPSVLAYWGPRADTFQHFFSAKGHVVRRRK